MDIEFGNPNVSLDKDDPVIFLQLAGSGAFDVAIPEADIFSAFSYIGDPKDKFGMVDFSSFTSLPGLSSATAISAFKIRETNDHIFVTGVTDVPEPAMLSLLAFGGLALLRRRRHSV